MDNLIGKNKKENNSIIILMYLSHILLNNTPIEIMIYIISFYDLLFENRSYYRIKEEDNFTCLILDNNYKAREDRYIVYCILNENEEEKYVYLEKLIMNCYLVTWKQYILFPSEKRAIYIFIRNLRFKTEYIKIHPCIMINEKDGKDIMIERGSNIQHNQIYKYRHSFICL